MDAIKSIIKAVRVRFELADEDMRSEIVRYILQMPFQHLASKILRIPESEIKRLSGKRYMHIVYPSTEYPVHDPDIPDIYFSRDPPE